MNPQNAITEEALVEQAKTSSHPTLGYYFMLLMAAAIASIGLIQDSAPAIIGAMIVAPLMAPIIGLAIGTLAGNRQLALTSLLAVCTGAVFVVAIAFGIAEIFGLRVVGPEISARTLPSTLDLVIAICAGGAAAFAHARLNIVNSIAGVAIAVALVPPLAVCGIGLAVGEAAVTDEGLEFADLNLGFGGHGNLMAAGAFLLFITNMIAIVAAALAVFAALGYGHWRRAIGVSLALLFSIGFITGQLDKQLELIYAEDRVKRLYAKAVENSENFATKELYVRRVGARRVNDQIEISMLFISQGKHLDDIEVLAEKFRQLISNDLGEEIVLKLTVMPLNIVSHTASPSD
ncbi:MAG: TIGR00341 family protein [Alphaproteobacteria bacterium]|nr:TIGR00341 family protein [Alphaproteobacteria bacterium SS10]